MENIDIQTVEQDSITITKPEESITIPRKEIEDKIAFLTGEISNLELALEGRNNDLAYYIELLGQFPESKLE